MYPTLTGETSLLPSVFQMYLSSYTPESPSLGPHRWGSCPLSPNPPHERSGVTPLLFADASTTARKSISVIFLTSLLRTAHALIRRTVDLPGNLALLSAPPRPPPLAVQDASLCTSRSGAGRGARGCPHAPGERPPSPPTGLHVTGPRPVTYSKAGG